MTIDPVALDGLAVCLLEKAGLKIGRDRHHALRRAMEERMAVLEIDDPDRYLSLLRESGERSERELRAVLPWVTIGTTYFFRDAHQFGALRTRLIPELLARVRSRGSPARIWSAGCASGEEAYSLAMAVAEAGAARTEVEIWATDVNPEALETARRGWYRERRLAGLPGKLFEKYFAREGDGYVVSPELRELIRFDLQNLAATAFTGVAPGTFDLILCRNVIIYFDLATVRGLMDRFQLALRSDGYLLLGYSESLFQIYDRLEMVEVEGAFIYRPVRRRARADDVEWVVPPTVEPVALPDRAPTPAPAPKGLADVKQGVAGAAAKMEQGDFRGALADLEARIKDRPEDLAAWLTLGNARSLFGLFREARDAFARVLSKDPRSVEARLYAGMAEMQAGLMQEARAELTRALELEPSLALGHYLLAQVAERLGERDNARRFYRNALAQISRPQRALVGYFPDMADSLGSIAAAARYALSALE